jgi:hypothetical protein
MKKKYPHTFLSDKMCREKTGYKKGRTVYCDKRLKLRLVEDKASHNITTCYQHGRAAKQA